MKHPLIIILGNQLFDPQMMRDAIETKKLPPVFMREDRELCTYFKFHKHKITLFLAAMRAYAKELKKAGFTVHYEKLGEDESSYDDALTVYIRENKIDHLYHFEIEDKFFESRIETLVKASKLTQTVWASPMFLTTRTAFREYLAKNKRPFMRTFYERQRKRFKILLDAKGEPIGGKWSFDEQNRRPLPKDHTPPSPFIKPGANLILRDVKSVCNEYFADHPGNTDDYWIPITRDEARAWLEKFLTERLANFGPYEDAMPMHSDFLYHSMLTPFLNMGLLTPAEIVKETIRIANRNKLNISSVEGFIRQIIGWREFVRGIYQNFDDKQRSTNFWNHHERLNDLWWKGGTDIPPLDHMIAKANTHAYAHHIERLMVAGNLMLLLEVEPADAHRWFMEFFIDSSDWVMGPNVYGMGIFSDGGIFATKPYICGSNYYRKMGGFKKGEWCDGVDGLYWGFVLKHASFFAKNPRLSMMVRTAEKMAPARRDLLEAAATELRAKLLMPKAKVKKERLRK